MPSSIFFLQLSCPVHWEKPILTGFSSVTSEQEKAKKTKMVVNRSPHVLNISMQFRFNKQYSKSSHLAVSKIVSITLNIVKTGAITSSKFKGISINVLEMQTDFETERSPMTILNS